MLNVFFLNEQAHALLAFVGNDFFGRESGVADGELAHVDQAAAFLHQFAQAVDVACATMVVDAHNGVDLFFAEGAHEVVGALLHFGVSALYGIEFDAAAVASRFYRRYATATEADAIVVATDHHDLVALLRLTLQAVALCAVAHTTSQHDDLVVGILLAVLLVLERKYRTRDEGLAKFVTEVAGAIRGFDENLLGCLVEPRAFGDVALALASGCCGIVLVALGGHIHGRTCDGPRTHAASHTVANLAARSCGGTVEGFYGGGEIVCLGFERDDGFDVLHLEVVARGVVGRSKLLDGRTGREGHVVLVGGKNFVGVLCCGLLNHGEEAGGLFLAVDDKGATEDLVAAVFRVDLCEAEHLRVGQFSAQLSFHFMEVFDFLGREGQAFLLVVRIEVVNINDGCGLDVHGEDVLVESLVAALQHGVECALGIAFCGGGEILFDTRNAVEIHVLRNLDGIRAPGGNHLTAWAYETALEAFAFKELCLAIEPAKFLYFFCGERMVHLGSDDALLRCLEE